MNGDDEERRAAHEMTEADSAPTEVRAESGLPSRRREGAYAMKAEYDRTTGALYVSLAEIEDGAVARTVELDCDDAMVHVDLDADGKPLGVEVLDTPRASVDAFLTSGNNTNPTEVVWNRARGYTHPTTERRR